DGFVQRCAAPPVLRRRQHVGTAVGMFALLGGRSDGDADSLSVDRRLLFRTVRHDVIADLQRLGVRLLFSLVDPGLRVQDDRFFLAILTLHHHVHAVDLCDTAHYCLIGGARGNRNHYETRQRDCHDPCSLHCTDSPVNCPWGTFGPSGPSHSCLYTSMTARLCPHRALGEWPERRAWAEEAPLASM